LAGARWSREHGGSVTARYRRGVQQDVTAAEHHLGVAVVDEVDPLVQVRADVARRERAAGPEPDQYSRHPLQDQATTPPPPRLPLRSATASSRNVHEFAVDRRRALDETHLGERRRIIADH